MDLAERVIAYNRISDLQTEIQHLKNLLRIKTDRSKNCTCKDSTGWTEKPCCNICGKQVEGK